METLLFKKQQALPAGKVFLIEGVSHPWQERFTPHQGEPPSWDFFVDLVHLCLKQVMADELAQRKRTISAFLKESSYLQHKTGNSHQKVCLFPSNRTQLVMSVLGFCISYGRLQNKSTSQFENVIQLSGIKVLCGI